MYITRLSVRPRQSIIDRQRKIIAQNKAIRLQHIKINLSLVALVGCIIASGFCN